MFTWPTILLTIMAVLLGAATSLALGRFIKNKIKDRQIVTGELEKLRRAEAQNKFDLETDPEYLEMIAEEEGRDAGRRP